MVISISIQKRMPVVVAPGRFVPGLGAAHAVKCAFELLDQESGMENNDQRYLVQQNKIADNATIPPVFAKVMRGKDGTFEGVSFIKNKDKATVMTVADANEVVAWAAKKKGNAHEYATKIICVGQ
jgi:hypothetical protein